MVKIGKNGIQVCVLVLLFIVRVSPCQFQKVKLKYYKNVYQVPPSFKKVVPMTTESTKTVAPANETSTSNNTNQITNQATNQTTTQGDTNSTVIPFDDYNFEVPNRLSLKKKNPSNPSRSTITTIKAKTVRAGSITKNVTMEETTTTVIDSTMKKGIHGIENGKATTTIKAYKTENVTMSANTTTNAENSTANINEIKNGTTSKEEKNSTDSIFGHFEETTTNTSIKNTNERFDETTTNTPIENADVDEAFEDTPDEDENTFDIDSLKNNENFN